MCSDEDYHDDGAICDPRPTTARTKKRTRTTEHLLSPKNPTERTIGNSETHIPAKLVRKSWDIPIIFIITDNTKRLTRPSPKVDQHSYIACSLLCRHYYVKLLTRSIHELCPQICVSNPTTSPPDSDRHSSLPTAPDAHALIVLGNVRQHTPPTSNTNVITPTETNNDVDYAAPLRLPRPTSASLKRTRRLPIFDHPPEISPRLHRILYFPHRFPHRPRTYYSLTTSPWTTS